MSENSLIYLKKTAFPRTSHINVQLYSVQLYKISFGDEVLFYGSLRQLTQLDYVTTKLRYQ